MNTGLVLSGGGIRGVAHIGALKALEERNIEITQISGSSAGAIIGAMYAGGMSWQEIFTFIKKVRIFHYRRYAYNKPGFIDSLKFYNDFSSLFAEDNFRALHKKLFISTTNLISGKEEIFNSGELIKPILASAAFPGLFTPVSINNALYIDGGVLNNFPIEPLYKKCNRIIGVYVNPLEDILPQDLKYSYEVVNRAYSINFAQQCAKKFSKCDILIAPPELSQYGMFNIKAMERIFDIGYKSAKAVLSQNLG